MSAIQAGWVLIALAVSAAGIVVLSQMSLLIVNEVNKSSKLLRDLTNRSERQLRLSCALPPSWRANSSVPLTEGNEKAAVKETAANPSTICLEANNIVNGGGQIFRISRRRFYGNQSTARRTFVNLLLGGAGARWPLLVVTRIAGLGQQGETEPAIGSFSESRGPRLKFHQIFEDSFFLDLSSSKVACS
ncbi:hypothetical protein CPB84DRAFT_1374277 [Gymnopilus junonius]|uniref:Uncharacterized protein n=1 Tax=Gymnopilus junonius TaxID=109634 RepID=A0A9P5TM02_GYMJU|nr:hypothetical protein CPB84DRAFT_1374277 [Gymnopilus junonius]